MFTTSYWTSDASSEESSFYELFQQLSTNSLFCPPDETETETKETASTAKTTATNTMVREGSPVLLTPTPGTGTVVRGIRRAKGNDWENVETDSANSLPINNGSEALGESIVIDFESPLFIGSFLLRVAGVKSSTDDGSNKNYFDGKNRRFQAIVRGKFLKEIPAGQCVTGQTFDRAPQRLPPLTKPFLRAVSAIAPQMEIDLYAARPYVLSSLVATAKTLNQLLPPQTTSSPPVAEACSLDDPNALSDEQETRKELLDRESVFETNREYTFEFYQHMLDLANPHDFLLNFAGWTVRLGPTLDGQPIRILGAWQEEGKELQYIWSFDLLHENHCQGAQ